MFFDWSTLKKLIWLRAAGVIGAVWKTVTNAAVAAFTAVAAPVRALVVDIDPVQDLHSYDNPWPGGGGKNKANPILTSQTISDVVITVKSDGTFKANGTSSADIRVTVATVTADSSASYILTGCPSGGSGTSYALMITDANSGDWASDYGSGSSAVSGSHVVSVTLVIKNGTAVNNLTFKPMIRLSTESDSTFAPYSNICPISGWTEANVWVEPTHDTTANPTVTIDLGGTRYGGTLDVTTGVLTVTMAYDEITSFIGKSATKANNAYYRNISGIKRISSSTTPNILSDMYVATTYATVTSAGNTTGIGVNEYGNIVIGYGLNSTITTLELANAWVSEHPFHICYELATPVTVQLTPAEVTTLLGQNNVWADTGNINTITYRER